MKNLLKSLNPKYIFKNEDIFIISKPASIGTFLLVAIIMTTLLSIRYYKNFYQNIIINGVAQKTITAKSNFQVVDKHRTELIKREVANKIRPVVAPVESEYIKSDLQKVIDDIEKIKKEKKDYQTKQKELVDLIEISDLDRKNKAIAYILNTNEANLTSTFTNTKYILNELLTAGIFDTDISNLLTESFMDKALGEHVKRNQYPLIITLIECSVASNLIIDEYATEVARKNAKSSVKPYMVTYRTGDNIIRAGERVTQLQRDALKESGYNAFELNKTGILGIFALVCVTMYSFILYIRKYEKRYYTLSYMSYIALSSIILTFCCIAISNMEPVSNYFMPFVAFTIMHAIFTNPVLAFLVSILMLSLLSLTLFLDSQLFFTFVIAILSSSYLVSKMSYSKRLDVIRCGFQVGMIMFCTMFFAGFFEVQAETFSRLLTSHPQNPLLGVANGLLASIVIIFIPIVEKICKVVSPYALIELADQNQELLSKMRGSAPGTFHHSLMVANLCEAAAGAIGADSILARVGAFYHDIGKLQRPLFFIENQSYFGVENPHTTLTPRQSKMVITLHTKDGVEIAKKYGLPQCVIDFIQQHHGESLAGHFYNKAIEQEGPENVTEGQFRYPGPKPKTKETAILMLADALESSVRALKNPTADEIEAKVNKIFTERLNDGQLSDSPLTLKDIKIIAMTFNKVLRGMQHERIKYQESVMNDINDKNKITIQSPQDEEFERKIREFQAKSVKLDEEKNEGES